MLQHWGEDVELRPYFSERDAAGSIRVQRPDGSTADAQLRWTYGFHDGLIHHAEVAPLAAPSRASLGRP